MSTQENSVDANSVLAGNGTNPPLVEVTSQLSPDSTALQPTTIAKPVKPQVVFVEQKRKTQIIEIHVEPKQAVAAPAAKPAVAAAQEHVPLPPVNVETAASEECEQRFAVDPFVYEIDGPIPVMPSIPIVKLKTSTDQVVAREKTGEHFAWRLMPVPYPSEGNVSQPSDSESIGSTRAIMDRTRPEPEVWAETEVVAEEQDCDHGDCFYAQSGDVIAIDGNKGFDHIDLRSYSIDDATFQRGAILLHADLQSAESGEGEELPAPITIQHRGIDFAVFKGEVRVEL